MEVLLGKVTQQAMNYAIRSGVSITAGYAIGQFSRLVKNVDKDSHEKDELRALQLRLESKIRIISPAIDMIELIAARGNTSLESAVTLTKSLRWDIQSLGQRLAKAASDEELLRKSVSKPGSRVEAEIELKLIVVAIKKLLDRIEDAVPLINLAITTSGVNLSTSLPATVSPSRLLQASTFLTSGDTQYSMSLSNSVQIGPVFTLSLYMLFSGHSNRPQFEDSIRETTWKEVLHKARVKLLRVPLHKVSSLPCTGTPYASPSKSTSNIHHDDTLPEKFPSEGKPHEFAYQLLVIEDLDDDRVHTFEEDEPQPGPFEDVESAGIREVIPIHEISKIFYADTGKILNIGADGETNNPILLLKRDVNANPPRRMMDQITEQHDLYQDIPESDYGDTNQAHLDAQIHREFSTAPDTDRDDEANIKAQAWRLPLDLDREWLAFEVYIEEPESGSEDEGTIDPPSSPPVHDSGFRSTSAGPSLASAFSNLHLRNSPLSSPPFPASSQIQPATSRVYSGSSLPAIRTSLSLLEMLVRLTALQQFQQASHLSIPDELLTFFLSESSTTGAGSDTQLRKRVRRDARRRVGFDPYDESPIKFRTEEYLQQGGQQFIDNAHHESNYEGDEHQYENSEWETPGSPNPDVPLPSREGPPPESSRAGTPSNVSSPLFRKSGTQSFPSGRVAGSCMVNRFPPAYQRAHSSPSRYQDDEPPFPQPRSQTGRPSTPSSGSKTRQGVLKREGTSMKSPLGKAQNLVVRSESDSAIGTSPSSADKAKEV
ncbi:Ran-binding-domain-containing protein [Patellaria atrata CBS 101060]|uniref:Ran-binding-domain-containing protein n=1 Tax=Patellaria atrata CBS 101060 TaxID=1346257 RepID=A0A9P4S7L0_9PEZI|nr:Ran-binding-domain-containing protein [Patellaria atrata CBS 101060]